MSMLKMNLRGGVAQLAQFTGIGKGLARPAARQKVEPFAGIGGKKVAAMGKKVASADPNPDPGDGSDDDTSDDGDGGDDADPGDDQALGDDDYGADAPSDDDTPEEAEAKRTSRVARRARRLKQSGASGDDGGDGDGSGDDPNQGDDTGDDADDPDSEMRGKSPAALARQRERARCAAIFAHPAAAKNPELAAELAFNTRLTRKEAIGTLAKGGNVQGGALARAMSGFAAQRPGTPPAQDQRPKVQQVIASWDSAFAQAAAQRNTGK